MSACCTYVASEFNGIVSFYRKLYVYQNDWELRALNLLFEVVGITARSDVLVGGTLDLMIVPICQ